MLQDQATGWDAGEKLASTNQKQITCGNDNKKNAGNVGVRCHYRTVVTPTLWLSFRHFGVIPAGNLLSQV